MNIKLNSYSKRESTSLKRIWVFVIIDEYSKSFYLKNSFSKGRSNVPNFKSFLSELS